MSTKEKTWLWVAIVVGLILLGIVWYKQSPKDQSQPNSGWIPSSQQPTPQTNPSQPAPPTGYQALLKQAKETGKKMVVYFGRSSPPCPPCERMKTEVLPDPKVQQALGNYVFCMIDVSQEPEIASKYNIAGTPSMLIIDGNETVQKKTEGFMTVDKFVKWLGGLEGQSEQPRSNQSH